jgi:transcriptional regulator with XRE-family HTH domain
VNYTLNMQDLGQRLEGIIKRRGVSKASVARETGLTPAIITGLCRGTHKSVHAETLGRLGVALRVSIDYLLGLSHDPGTPSERLGQKRQHHSLRSANAHARRLWRSEEALWNHMSMTRFSVP